jgi:arginine deiminase
LLADTLAIGAARDEVLERTLEAVALGPELTKALTEWLGEVEPAELTRRLIAGVTYEELPFASSSLTARVSAPWQFVLPPLPNQMFTRDASAWAYGGVSIHSMAMPARRREAAHFEAIYRNHPLFTQTEHKVWNDGMKRAPELEGGDVFVLGNAALLIGIGERTRPAAVEFYAQRLFREGVVARVIVAVLPNSRSTIHLDTLMTMVDVDAFAAALPLCAALDSYTLTPARNGVQAEAEDGVFTAIAAALDLPAVHVIHPVGDRSTTEQEQWNQGSNVLAIGPGVVVAYERNRITNARLREHGTEVITVPDSELARGRGGPRCLTCPIERADPPRLTAV